MYLSKINREQLEPSFINHLLKKRRKRWLTQGDRICINNTMKVHLIFISTLSCLRRFTLLLLLVTTIEIGLLGQCGFHRLCRDALTK